VIQLKPKNAVLILFSVVAASILARPVLATMNAQASVSLNADNILVIRSDQRSIQNVIIEGNLTTAIYSRGPYPANNFTITTDPTQQYAKTNELQYILNMTLSDGLSSYSVFVETRDPPSNSISQVTSYYVSSGELDLAITAVFQPSPTGPPMWPAGSALVISNVDYTSLVLSWPNASGDAEISGYQIYEGTTLIASVQADVHSYTVSGLTPGGAYTFSVRAEDSAGNQSSTSLSQTETMPIQQPILQQYYYVLVTGLVGAVAFAELAFILVRRRRNNTQQP